MRLRTLCLLACLLVLILAAPIAGEAQQSGKIPRIGVLTAQSPAGSPPAYGLRQGLRELGYVESQNIAVEWRWAPERAERLPDLAAELVRMNVDLIVASGNPVVRAAQRATRTIPIVMVHGTDPVGLGFVASLARPGGNITGLSLQSPELTGKRLQLLKEAIPNLSRVGILWDPAFPGGRFEVTEAEVAARALGIGLHLLEAGSAGEFERAFAAITREGTAAALAVGSPAFFAHRARITENAIKSRLPTICATREYAEAGCLISYGASLTDLYRRAAYFVDKILKGAKPADLPVEQPTKFELVINLKTAKALGLTIPQSLLLRADRVIQ
jgi:putative ABC transport system substrate-binding protein